MSVGASSQFAIDSISNIGPHYARTLREWRSKFEEKFESVIEPALKNEHPGVMTGENGRYEIEVFKRKWICKRSPKYFATSIPELNHLCRLLVRTTHLLGFLAVELTCWYPPIYSCYSESGFSLRSLGGPYAATLPL